MTRRQWMPVILAGLLLFPAVSFASTIDIGVISFDNIIPDGATPGINAFDVGNFTGDPLLGGSAFLPDFPVLDFLTFLSGSVTLTNPDGSSAGPPISLGDIDTSGFSAPAADQFSDTISFGSATFTATLNEGIFQLADGNTFTVDSTTVSAEIIPSSGTSLEAGTDFAILTVNGTESSPSATVPEPESLVLLATGLVGMMSLRMKRFTP